MNVKPAEQWIREYMNRGYGDDPEYHPYKPNAKRFLTDFFEVSNERIMAFIVEIQKQAYEAGHRDVNEKEGNL